jgi:hypothetical protein
MRHGNFSFGSKTLDRQFDEFLDKLDEKGYGYIFYQNIMIKFENDVCVSLSLDFNTDIDRFEACVVANHKAIQNIKGMDLYTAKNPTFFYADTLDKAFDELEQKYGKGNN